MIPGAPEGSAALPDGSTFKHVDEPIPGYTLRHSPAEHHGGTCIHADGICYSFHTEAEFSAEHVVCQHCGRDFGRLGAGQAI